MFAFLQNLVFFGLTLPLESFEVKNFPPDGRIKDLPIVVANLQSTFQNAKPATADWKTDFSGLLPGRLT